MPNADSEPVVGLYERHADAWDTARRTELVIERAWMERLLELIPVGGSILDIGCGSGQPIARFLIERGYRLTGVDSSATLIARCKERFPDHEWLVGDMRSLSLGRPFQGLIAWNSFFHLDQDSQRAMFPIFREHAGPGAPLLLTTGPEAGELIGSFAGEPLYHASLSPAEYRELLTDNGFEVIAHMANDPTCGDSTVWLVRRRSL